MNKKIISIVIGAVLVVGIGTFVYTTKKPILVNNVNDIQTVKTPLVDTPKIITQSVPATQATPVSGITLATVASHNSKTSCWSAVNGSVYDLTSWIPNHPGGEGAILSLCGIDGSNDYNDQHGGSSKPARILGGFKLGALAK